jgi:acylphosphatase
MFAVKVIVSGRVQLVMFRDFVQRKASHLKLLGTVRNMPDGTVEVRAEGEKVKLDTLVALLHTGPVLARVDGVAVEWVEPKGNFQGFTINYS